MPPEPPLTAAELPIWFVRVVAFTWGAVWGSFANVVIYRWPRELSLTRPGSRCPHCEKPVRPYDNVPILGWLWLRGRCRDCKAPISPRYPFVESLYALAALVVAERIARGDPPLVVSVATALFLLRFAFAWGLLTVAFIDMEVFLIPDFISLGGTALGLVGALALPGPGWQPSAMGAALGFSILYALHFVWSRFLKREGMGLGDAKLLAMIGAFLGPKGVFFALVAGSVQGLLATVVSRVTGLRIGADPKILLEIDAEAERNAAAAEAAKKGTAKDEAPKDEAPKDEAPKDEAPKDEAPNGEAPKDEAPNSEAPNGEASDEDDFMRTAIPFGPFLALGALEFLLGMDVWFDAALDALYAP